MHPAISRRASAGSVPCRPPARGGFSLTELLVAMTIMLVVMGAVAALFGVYGRAVSQSQATIDLSGKLRAASWLLRQDLAGVTVPLVPWTPPEADAGYFELIEGPQRDATLAVSGSATANLEADTDDILLFTTRATAGPFTGRYDAGTIEADCAEVAWFCRAAGDQPVTGTKVYNLHRRQLLVPGYVGTVLFNAGTNSIPRGSLITGTASTPIYDLSLRLTDSPAGGTSAYSSATVAFPNTLGDLTKRENRFLLGGTTPLRTGTFPYVFLTDTSARAYANTTFDETDRVWEDVVLTNVIGFDVRVFDPQAPVLSGSTATGTASYLPGDPGYVLSGTTLTTSGSGAYVDLGWGASGTTTRSPVGIGSLFPPPGQTAFQSDGVFVSGTTMLVSGTFPAQRNAVTYDTWSLHYEFNGIDDDGDGPVDEGSNGVDDNGNGVPDDAAEYETSPPYPVPLRGLEVRIRCYEPSSKQVRQITVRHTFVDR